MGIVARYEDLNIKWGIWEINEDTAELIREARHLKYFLTTIEQFGSEMRQKQWLAVRVLTDILQKNATIEYLDSGKPTIYDKFISISHSGKRVAVAISDSREVGVDIQLIDSKVERIKHKFLNDEELNKFSTLEDLTIVWSIKEALYKLYGDGSPYFKTDYNVLTIDQNAAIATMQYQEQLKTLSVKIRMHDGYALAFVTE